MNCNQKNPNKIIGNFSNILRMREMRKKNRMRDDDAVCFCYI